ncbi:hypothetical protein M1105_04395 [Limibaculum sp. FT325]|uniref:F0F1 ATP synthase subunit B family protein n=1 Tax=Thermohalobaculum sediminis TaxID=2939436 RepID=UPI0020C0361B|nr:hypothetical protein [Limibaculum sediminis]MCL5776228.1 hypothetical protein [Limibaculum sediminis]
MQIDWITVAAQIVNFLVLLWILQRLVYRPLSRAMEARERRVREGFETAEAKAAEAAREAERLREERAELEARRREFLDAAAHEAGELRQRLAVEAREEAEAERRAWADRLEAASEAFVREMRERAAGALAETARRALDELASLPLDEAIAHAFARRLDELADEDAAALREAARHEGAAVLEAAFTLGEEPARLLTAAARRLLGDEVALTLARNPDLVCGVRLKARGRSVQLSLDAWLDRFAAALDEAIADLAPEVRSDGEAT